jgi:hypothetical protein
VDSTDRPIPAPDRRTEWFVPKFGPLKFRLFIGLLFLPYTGMVLSFAVMGSMIAPTVYWDRVPAIVLIYFFGLGVAAHALDALGSKEAKPWGAVFTKKQLRLLAASSLIAAYAVAGWYILRVVPFLLVLAVLEGFFVFAYNLEWFGGRFHTDNWFAVSWGGLPVLAGYVMQANTVNPAALILACAAALLALVEIKASRPYKELKKRASGLESDRLLLGRYEAILKCISLGTILLGIGLLFFRLG